MTDAHLSPIAQANLLAGHAVSYATSFLDGRSDAAALAGNAERMFLDLMIVRHPDTNGILDPVRLLTVAMMRTSRYGLSHDRREKWQAVMGSLVELVCHESRQLRDQDKQQETRR